MAEFTYKAKTKEADHIGGNITASSREEALAELNRRGFIVVSIEPVNASCRRRHSRKSWRAFSGVSAKELIDFTTRMVSLIRAGVPLLRSLSLMAEQARNAHFREVLVSIANDVKAGRELSESMACYPDVFSGFYVAMVRSGERTGKLDDAMTTLADYYTRQRRLAAKVRNAMAYPVLVLVVGLLTMLFVFTNVMPKILPVLLTLDTELPFVTRLVMGFTDFLRGEWRWLILGMLIFTALFARALKNAHFREYLSAFRLSIPVVGGLIQKAEMARFMRALQICVASGIPVTSGIRIALPIIREVSIAGKMKDCPHAIEKGETLEKAFRSSGVFDDFVLNMIRVGEESGDLTGTLSHMAEEFESDVASRVDLMVNMLEPVVILLIGLVIGLIVFAVLLPVFNLDFIGI